MTALPSRGEVSEMMRKRIEALEAMCLRTEEHWREACKAGEELKAENAQLRAIPHSCHDGCTVPDCVNRRLREENARLKEALTGKLTEDDAGNEFTYVMVLKERVAELEVQHNDMVLIRERMYRQNTALEAVLSTAEGALDSLYNGTAWSSIGYDDVWRAVRNQSRSGSFAEALERAREALEKLK